MTIVAPAKINLMLHITGRRKDGYHELQSVMTCLDAGDILSFRSSDGYALHVEGPFAHHAPENVGENLVTRAVHIMEDTTGLSANLHIRLSKNIPAGAGFGGGSADAAATMHALNRLWGYPLDMEALCAAGFDLGADIPFMLRGSPSWMEGAGERHTPVFLEKEKIFVVLLWPCVSLASSKVYEEYAQNEQDFSAPVLLPEKISVEWLLQQRNDLTEAAMRLVPEIGVALDALSVCAGCLFSRMTGSGSAVFGVFKDGNAALEAAEKLSKEHPSWWVRQSFVTVA